MNIRAIYGKLAISLPYSKSEAMKSRIWNETKSVDWKGIPAFIQLYSTNSTTVHLHEWWSSCNCSPTPLYMSITSTVRRSDMASPTVCIKTELLHTHNYALIKKAPDNRLGWDPAIFLNQSLTTWVPWIMTSLPGWWVVWVHTAGWLLPEQLLIAWGKQKQNKKTSKKQTNKQTKVTCRWPSVNVK